MITHCPKDLLCFRLWL